MVDSSDQPASSTSGVTLPGLYDVDWSKLDHAYGEAGDTPGLLNTLYQTACSDDYADGDADDAAVKSVSTAFFELHASITHQGSRYTASRAAVPFVYHTLGVSKKQYNVVRSKLLVLLGCLAVGSPKYWLPSRRDVANWRSSTAARQAPGWPDEEMARREAFVEAARREAEASDDWSTFRRQEFRVELMTDPEQMAATSVAELGTYDAVKQGLNAVYDCLGDEHPDVRSEAVFLLSLFPEHGTVEASEKVLRERLAVETVATVRGTILLSLALLRQKLPCPPPPPASDNTETEKDAHDGPVPIPIPTSDNTEKDVHDDMHPPVEVEDDDSDRAARASVKELIEEVHAAAKAQRQGDLDADADAEAYFEQWCTAAALLILCGIEGVSDSALADGLAPMVDKKGIFARFEPRELYKQAKKARLVKKEAGEKGETSKLYEESFPFPSEDLASFVTPLIGEVKGSEHPDVARILVDAVVGVKGLEGGELVNLTLQMVFGTEKYEWIPYTYTGDVNADPSPKTTLPSFANLTELQQAAVSAVARVDESCWTSETFKSTVQMYGLPGDRAELEKYIEGKEFKRDAPAEGEPEEKRQRTE